MPPETDVELEVELLRVLSSTTLANLTPAEKVVEFRRRKMVGNEHYARKAFKKAQRSYLSVITSLADAEFPEDVDMGEVRQLQIDCGNNLAMVCMRLGNVEQAKEAVIEVLQMDPTNTKALFRGGQISSQQGNFEEARMALRKALEANPESSEVKAELGRLASRVKAYQARKRAMQETMGRNLFGETEKDSSSDGSQAPGAGQGEGRGEETSHQPRKEEVASRSTDVDANVPSRALGKNSRTFDGVLWRLVIVPVVVVLVAWGAAYVSASLL